MLLSKTVDLCWLKPCSQQTHAFPNAAFRENTHFQTRVWSDVKRKGRNAVTRLTALIKVFRTGFEFGNKWRPRAEMPEEHFIAHRSPGWVRSLRWCVCVETDGRDAMGVALLTVIFLGAEQNGSWGIPDAARNISEDSVGHREILLPVVFLHWLILRSHGGNWSTEFHLVSKLGQGG